jgi:hypothetical protein
MKGMPCSHAQRISVNVPSAAPGLIVNGKHVIKDSTKHSNSIHSVSNLSEKSQKKKPFTIGGSQAVIHRKQ